MRKIIISAPARALAHTRTAISDATETAIGRSVNLAARLQPHRRLADLHYGSGPRQRLDLYAPKEARDAPVVVFFYGGYWNSGAKELYRFLGASLAARGFLVAVPDYSLYPAARYPAFLEDAAAALCWTRENAPRFSADPARLFVMGHSAGAHIAAMLGFEKRWLSGVGLSNARDIAGVIGLAGAYNFEIDGELLCGVFGGPEAKDRTQPLAHVTREAPPLLLATGVDDETVGAHNTRDLAAAVRRVGGEVETIYYPGLGHREIVGAFSPLLRFFAPVLDDVSAFVSTKSPRVANTATQGGGSERGLDERV